MQRDKIDFGSTSVRTLFIRQLVPTIMGMVSTALFVITDGIFVGRGIGSDGLAAVNIAVPLSMFAAGIGLMFGMGGAIVASINLSRGKTKVANINTTQTLVVSSLLTLLIALVAVINPRWVAPLMGAREHLVPLAAEYLFWYSIFMVFYVVDTALPFFVRISRPKFAMWVMLLAAGMNIFLDYILIFVMGWGLTGAAVATGAGQITATILLLSFLGSKRSVINLTRFKLSIKSIRLTLRNTGYIVRLGFSSLLGEATLAVMMLVGNYVFIDFLGAEGVAAYSIVCYLVPVFFMLFNGIIQSAQPVISYNYGIGNAARYRGTFRLAMKTGVISGLVSTIGMAVFGGAITSLFVTDLGSNTALYAREGLPLFALDLTLFAVNMIYIGYYMSIKKTGLAVLFTLMRCMLPVVTFFTLPSLLGIKGIWLAVPAAEVMTFLFIIFITAYDGKRHRAAIEKAYTSPIQA